MPVFKNQTGWLTRGRMMKKVWGRLIGVLVISLAAPGRADPSLFRAGAARGNITPELGNGIVGGFTTFPATHVHDDLWVRCLALDDGKTRLAFAVCDLIGFESCVSGEARRLVQEETGLPACNLLVSATHTHSAVCARGDIDIYTANPKMTAYQKAVARRIADTVRCALNNLAPARIGWATATEPRHVFNRRWLLKPGTVSEDPFGGTNDLVKMNPGRLNPNVVKPAGPTDPEICFFAVQTPEGRPIALFANYSLHYVGGVRGADISADYYGMFNDRIQQLLGADRQNPPFVSIMSNGTSGDINNIDFTKPGEKLPPYAKMRIVANDVAQKVHAAYQTIQWRDRVTLGASVGELEMRLRHPTPEQLAWAEAVLRAKAAGGKGDAMKSYFAERHVRMVKEPEHVKVPLQVLRVGEVGIAAMPFEVFCATGLEIKRSSPFKPTFVVGLANGCFDYLPTPEQHKLGGYETWLESCLLEPDAEPKIVETLLGMLTRLQAGG